MKLIDIEHPVDASLPANSILYRVQRQRSRPGTVAVNALRLPPRGLLLGRFDLPDDEVGYFAESGDAAVYETLARREALSLSMTTLAGRMLLTCRTNQPLHLLDVRPHTHSWPVLQSLRYGATQQLALEARDQGYQGILYLSAQQHGADCVAIFGDALRHIALQRKRTLVDGRTGALHVAAAVALRGSQVLLTP